MSIIFLQQILSSRLLLVVIVGTKKVILEIVSNLNRYQLTTCDLL